MIAPVSYRREVRYAEPHRTNRRRDGRVPPSIAETSGRTSPRRTRWFDPLILVLATPAQFNVAAGMAKSIASVGRKGTRHSAYAKSVDGYLGELVVESTVRADPTDLVSLTHQSC
jgi:hypothetical protein